MEREQRGAEHRADYSDAVTGSTDPDESSAERTLEDPDAEGDAEAPEKKHGALTPAELNQAERELGVGTPKRSRR